MVPGLRRVLTTAGWITLFGLAVVLPLLRQTGTPPWDVFWAEDGTTYFRDAVADGPATLFRGYQGYVQVVPRLLALPVAWVPLEQAPWYAAVTSSIVGALIGAFVFRATKGFIRTTGMRLVVAATYVVAPVLGWEGAGNWTNLIWSVLGTVPWAIVSRRTSILDTTTRVLVVLLAPLCQPLAVVFLPLALAMAWRRRARSAWLVAGGLTVGLVAQGFLMLTSAPRHDPLAFVPLDMAKTISLSFFGSFLVGEQAAPAAWLRFGTTATVVFVVVTVALFAGLLWAASVAARTRAAVWIGYALALAAAPLISNGTAGTRPVLGFPLAPIERYVTVPMFLFVAAVAMLVDAPDASREHLVARVARPLFVAQLCVLTLVGFRVTNPRSTAPGWGDQVATARERCRSDAPGEVELSISPVPWTTRLACSAVGPGP